MAIIIIIIIIWFIDSMPHYIWVILHAGVFF